MATSELAALRVPSADLRLGTWANAITLVRTAIAIPLAFLALREQSLDLLIAAYAVYWLGDTLDGMAARWRGECTRLGAVFDIISDRACTAPCAAALVVIWPWAMPTVAAFMVSFMVLDTMLSLSFLYWPIVTPNDFHRVDRTVWALNWSMPAKALNTAGVVLLLALVGQAAALTLLVGVAAVKVWSVARVVQLLSTAGSVGADPCDSRTE